MPNLLKKLFIVLIAIAGVLNCPAQRIQLVHPTNSVWKWIAPVNDPGFGLSWTEVEFDDSSWGSGKMPLGFPASENIGYQLLSIQTAGGTVLPVGFVSYYFRHSFVWTNGPSTVVVTTTNWVDDGAAVFINGLEVYRVGMTNGPITHSLPPGIERGDLAARFMGDSASGLAFLTNGVNVIAATVRNNVSTSSDLVWAADISVQRTNLAIITKHPRSTNIIEGETISLAVQGNAPGASFQWFIENTPIPGATSPSYSVTNAILDQAGRYYVTISNSSGVLTSEVATVAIDPLRILSPLATSVDMVEGNELRLSVQLNGSAEFAWYLNGELLDATLNPPAATANLVVTNFGSANAGTYEVYASNQFRRLEPVINFFQFLSVQCIYIPALRLGWKTNEKVIQVM